MASGLEDGVPKQEEAAVNILRNLVEMVIGDNHDPAHTDFAKEMRGQLVQGVVNSNKTIMDLTKKIIRCKTLSKRFTAKSVNNLIVRMLDTRISEMERQIAVVENERDNIEAAQALLETYEYTVDPTPQYVGFGTQANMMAGLGMGYAAQ